ncbi:unnamed protein product [Peniophora sp. CBMAI 1063]|nr:unnamed protein product [Peniophora sp. CBMAI 1063]
MYCLVELETHDLGALNVDFMRLVSTADHPFTRAILPDTSFSQPQLDSGFVVHVFTARPSPSASSAGVVYETRMFGPGLGVNEDHVSGSTQGLLAPHWAAKLGLGERTMLSHQASTRGGDLWVTFDKEKGLVRLAGRAVKVAEGSICA